MSNSSSATTVIEIYDGYIDDENSKKSERFQPPYKFLFSGRIPEIGQRAEIHATAMSGHGCRLSGIVTHVGDLPTFDQWVTTTCIVPVPCDCFGQDPFSKLSPDTMMPFDPDCRLPQNHCFRCRLRKEGETEATFGTMMNRFHELEGTIHGQEITVFAYVSYIFVIVCGLMIRLARTSTTTHHHFVLVCCAGI